eukprot:767230-Hanusia_phi.AAC.1
MVHPTGPYEEYTQQQGHETFLTDQEDQEETKLYTLLSNYARSDMYPKYGALEDEELEDWDQIRANQVKFGKPAPVFDEEEYGIVLSRGAENVENDNEYENKGNNTEEIDEETCFSRVLPPKPSSIFEDDSLTSELTSEPLYLRESNLSGDDYDTVELRGLAAAFNYVANDMKDWVEGDISEFVPMKKEEFPPAVLEWLEENQYDINPTFRKGLVEEGWIKSRPRPPRKLKGQPENLEARLNDVNPTDISIPRPGNPPPDVLSSSSS